MFCASIDEHCLLMVIFPSKTGVGVVKYHAAEARQQIANQLKIAQQRDPGRGVDLSVLNLADPSEVFRRKL